MLDSLKNKIEKSFPLIDIKGNEIRKILYFKIEQTNVLPGQFYMLNYYGCQKPFSVSNYKKENHDYIIIGFTIEDRGQCSKSMVNAKKGEYFGLTGPLGNGFKTNEYKKFLLIAGGVGIGPILFLGNHIAFKGKDSDLIIGERNNDRIIYHEEINNLKTSINLPCTIYTDDGSFGIKGFPTDCLEEKLKNKKYDTAYICGPEIMMKKAIDIIKEYIPETDIQICMERYMKCGLGLCGSCTLDDMGDRVCIEGPVFNYSVLKKSKEFGNYKRDGYGIITKI